MVTDCPVNAIGLNEILKSLKPPDGTPVKVQTVAPGIDLLDRIGAAAFDLVVVELLYTDVGTWERLDKQKIKAPVLILSQATELSIVQRLYRTGISGLLAIGSKREEIMDAIKTVALDRQLFLSEAFKRYMIGNLINDISAFPLSLLSKRELQVAELLLQGGKVKDIGKELALKISTVSTFKNRIFHKFGVKNIIELHNALKETIV